MTNIRNKKYSGDGNPGGQNKDEPAFPITERLYMLK